MDAINIIHKNGLYYSGSTISYKMAIVGQFLARDVGDSSIVFFRNWALADKDNPNGKFSHTIGGNSTSLEEGEDGFIYITMDFEDKVSESNSVKMSRQQFVQLLDDWHEKVCKPKTKEAVVKYENENFIIKTTD